MNAIDLLWKDYENKKEELRVKNREKTTAYKDEERSISDIITKQALKLKTICFEGDNTQKEKRNLKNKIFMLKGIRKLFRKKRAEIRGDYKEKEKEYQNKIKMLVGLIKWYQAEREDIWLRKYKDFDQEGDQKGSWYNECKNRCRIKGC